EQSGQWNTIAGQSAAAKADYQAGLDTLSKWTTRTGDPELYIAQGDLQQKLGNKTDALTAYQTALDRAKDNTEVLTRLPEKFKAVGRADLADKADEKKKEVVAKQELERKKREDEQKKQAAAAAAKSKPANAAGTPVGGASAPSKTITV